MSRHAPRAARPGQRLRRLVLLTVAPAVLLLGGAALPAPAYADGLDDLCKTVPTPVRPDYQVAGLVMDKPDLAKVPAAAPDPFQDPKVPIADVYGWAWRYTNYDLGCGNDFIRDPGAVANTSIANNAIAGVDTVASLIGSMENLAHAAGFDWIKPVVTSIGDTLKDRVLTVWLPLALLLLSVVVGASASKASYATTFRRLQIVLVAAVLAVVSLVFPAKAADLMDQGASTVADAAQAGFQTRASDLITRESLYKTWLVGNFGSADSPTAAEYGPRLMSALTYTWSDVKRMQADPAAQAGIDKAKATEYKTIAAEVQKKDPAAYQSLTGKTDTRTAATFLGLVWVALMGFFVALAALLTVLARLIMIFLVVAAMIGSVVGVVHFGTLQRLWDLFTAALLNVVKFTLAGGVMTLILGAIQNAPVGLGWRLLFAIIATVIAIMITRPLHSFKSMAGMDPSKSLVAGLLRRAAGTALGLVAGDKMIHPDRDPTPQEPATTTAGASRGPNPGWTQTVEPAMPSLSASPSWQAVPAGSARQQAQLRWVGAEAYGSTGQARGTLEPASSATRQELAAPVSARRLALPVGTGAVSGASRAAEPPLDARPTFEEQTRLPEPGLGGGGSVPARPLVTTGGLPSGAAPAVSGAATGPVVPEGSVVYPTGVIVQRDSGLYRSAQSAARNDEEYLRLPEPQVDATGAETWTPTYHAEAAR